MEKRRFAVLDRPHQPKDGLPFDFNQIRVFTWNVKRHRYETAYRERMEGVLPVPCDKKISTKKECCPYSPFVCTTTRQRQRAQIQAQHSDRASSARPRRRTGALTAKMRNADRKETRQRRDASSRQI